MSDLLAVGIGNTTVSCGLHRQHRDTSRRWLAQFDCETAKLHLDGFTSHLPEAPCRWLVASVNRPAEQVLRTWVANNRPGDEYKRLMHQDLKLATNVRYPERVGMDRLVAALAANRLRDASRPAVIIDAGTAITVDLVDAAGTFQGGAILPGFRLVARALAAGTDALPEADSLFASTAPPTVGKATEEAIRSGLFWGGVGAINELVRRMSAELDEKPQVFVAGGDAELVAEHLAAEAVFVADLVLQGILLAAGVE